MESRHYLPVPDLPAGFIYPAANRAFVDSCTPDIAAIPGLPPWIFSGNLAWAVRESVDMFGMHLVPFAQAVQQDLLAYFIADSSGAAKVLLTNPWEPDEQFRYFQEFASFEAWMDFARTYSNDFLAENPEYFSKLAWFPDGPPES